MSGRVKAWARTRLIVSLARQHARERGFDGQISYLRSRDAIEFEGKGLFELSIVRQRLAGLTEAQAESALESLVNAFLQRHHELPSGWESDDEQLLNAVRRTLFQHATKPPSPAIDERLARFERLFGRAGWEDRLRTAAHRYVERAGAEPHLKSWLLHALFIHVELDEQDEAGRIARLMLERMSLDRGSDGVPARLTGDELTAFCFATLMADGRARTAALSETQTDLSSSEVALSLVRAADAVERGQVPELKDELESAARWRRRIDADTPHFVMSGGRSWHVAEEMLSRWLSELSDTPVEGTQQPQPTKTIVTELWQGEVAALRWASGAVEIDSADGVRSIPFAGPTDVLQIDAPAHVSDRLDVSDGRVTLRDGTGASIVLHESDPDEWNHLEFRWSPDREYLALFPEHGPFTVVRRSGALVGEFFGHEDGPNLGAAFTGDRMVSWAGDGQLAIYDLERRRLRLTIDIDAWAEDASLDPNGRLVAALHPEEGWCVYDIDSVTRVGPTRPARFAAWHPLLSAMALSDGATAWVETYD